MKSNQTSSGFTQVLRRTIDDDLASETPDRLADVIYLHFMLANNIENQLTDNLVDRLASEVDLVLNRGETSRYADRDITAAVFGAFVLSHAGISKVVWDREKIATLLKPYRKGDLYFDNLTYTLLIGIADSSLSLNLGIKEDLIQNIPERIRSRQLFNDGKNVAITCLFALESQSKTLVAELLENSLALMERGEIPFDERVYNAWVIWKNRELIEKSKLKVVARYTDSTLQNVVGLIGESPEESSISLVFGTDSRRRFSRILMGFALDLASSFERNTYRVTDREIKTLSLTGRMSTAIMSGVLVYVSFQFLVWMSNAGLLGALPNTGISAAFVGTVLLSIVGFLVPVTLVATASSVFWDATINSILPDRIIWTNTMKRLRRFLIEIVIAAIMGRAVELLI
ncbi:MAG: hypothetical protein JRN62_01025 [Nitrososphaerota archaeon]|nr:hypothetical protein [Nitrososphaerota archaeon]